MYGRTFRLVNADGFTLRFYSEKLGVELGAHPHCRWFTLVAFVFVVFVLAAALVVVAAAAFGLLVGVLLPLLLLQMWFSPVDLVPACGLHPVY